MLRPLFAAIAITSLFAAPARANDFPTAARVDYVLACSQGNPSRSAVTACACRIDAFAVRFAYDDWVAIETALSLQSVPGRRATAIRQIGWVKDLLDRFRAAEADAEFECR